MEGEHERAKLAADYPAWRIWRNGTMVYAWQHPSSPPVVLRDATVAGLRARLGEFARVRAAGRPLLEALAAAGDLET